MLASCTCVLHVCLPVKQRACPLEVLLFSPVLLSPAVCSPPPASWPRLPHADLFNCLPVPQLTCECVRTVMLCQGGQAQQQKTTHMWHREPERYNAHPHSNCQMHVVNGCPIKMGLKQIWWLFLGVLQEKRNFCFLLLLLPSLSQVHWN